MHASKFAQDRAKLSCYCTDTRIEMNNGWLAVMHTTGVNFKRYHFSGLKSNTDQFEWCARQSGGILDVSPSMIRCSFHGTYSSHFTKCTNLRSKEVIASYRPTSWAAMKKAELIINKNYAIDTDLLLMSVIGFVGKQVCAWSCGRDRVWSLIGCCTLDRMEERQRR